MVKVITFLKRKAGMPVEEFQSYWRTRHPEVVTRLPGVRRYVQSHALLSIHGHEDPIYDGIAEVWADDTDALRAMTRGPEHAALQADEARFIDRAGMGVIITEDHVIKDGPAPAGGVKRIRFVARQAQVPVDEFFSRFLEHGARCAQAAQVRRYVQCHCRRAIYDSGRTPAFDGAAMSWYDDLKALNATREPELTVAARAPLMLVSERVVSIP